MKISHLEKHTYAPELNKIHLLNGVTINASGINNISDALIFLRKNYFKQAKNYTKYFNIIVKHAKNTSCNAIYNVVMLDYKDIKEIKKQLKQRHNLSDATFKITVKSIYN